MTDFHAHLLPGIDDGSDSVETSLRMLELWRTQGIRQICCTPHFYADQNTPQHFLRQRAEAFESLRQAMEEEGGPWPELLPGAEVHFFDGMSQSQDLDRLCLTGTDLLLLEMPFTRWTSRMLAEVSGIIRRGIQPVAAHIERYFDLNSPKTIRQLVEMGVWIQCNAGFFLARRTARKALHMLTNGQIQFLGSDAHNVSTRQPNLGPALELIRKKTGQDARQYLLTLDDMRLDAESGFLI